MIHRLGDFTQKIANIPIGTEVKLEGPFGMFNDEVKADKSPIILYGLGSGVAPLISLALQYAGNKQLHLIWSGPQVNNPHYQELLTELRTRGVKVDAQVHRFMPKDLIRIISSNELKKANVIIVGSAPRVLLVRRQLRRLGFNKARLLDERMTI